MNRLRRRQRRNLLATLLLSQGVPMLLGGDELGRTQQGNNNAYCQDNEISWFDWSRKDDELIEFVRRLIELRLQHPTFRRRQFFQGQPIQGDDVDDIGWFAPDGERMTDESWRSSGNLAIGVFLNGDALPNVGPRGERITDDSFVALFNASDADLDFVLPDSSFGAEWARVLDTAPDDVDDALPHTGDGRSATAVPHRGEDHFKAGAAVPVMERSLVLLRRLPEPESG